MTLLIKVLEIKDLYHVAQLHRLAFTQSLLTYLGQEVVRRYYEWLLLGPHETTALGAFADDMLVGFCFGGIFRGAMNGFIRKNRYYLMWKICTHPKVVKNAEFRQRMALGWKSKIFRKVNLYHGVSMPTPLYRHSGILAIGVDPMMQRKGIGKLLMEAAEEQARQKGHREMRLTVEINNLVAINFYENIGWEKVPSQEGTFQGAMRKIITR
ncbi:MAG: GNAT family N-acetyltransferase [Desulfobacca sp.]|nr:GNAT family N-acetyltransferase [Desulfobacca sp.]